MIKRALSTLLALLLRLFAAVVVGVLLLALVYTIPTGRIRENLIRSAPTIKAEGTYHQLTPYAVSSLDNWTDSIMLLSAVYPAEGEEASPFVNAMQVSRYAYGDDFPNESLVHYAETGEYHLVTSYPQYWHGYLLFLKPLLWAMDFPHIRLLNGCVQLALSALLAVLLYRRGLKAYILPYLLSIGMLMPLATAKCLQYSSCFYVFSLSSLALLCMKADAPKRRRELFVFFWAGIATAYFDFLTYPISTYGVPAVFYLLCRKPRRVSEALKALTLALLLWGFGYGGMWLSKLLVGSWITGIDYFGAAGSHVGHWFNGERWFSVAYVFYYNTRDYAYTPVTFASLLFACVVVVKSLRTRRRLSLPDFAAAVIPFLVLALLPYCWYLVMLNPSGIHFFFTNKALVVTAFAGLSMLVRVLEVKTGFKMASE